MSTEKQKTAVEKAAASAAFATEIRAKWLASAVATKRTVSAARLCAQISGDLERAAIAEVPKAPRPKYGRIRLANDGEVVAYKGRHKGRTHQMSEWIVQFQGIVTRHGAWLWDDVSAPKWKTGLNASASIGSHCVAAGYTLSELPQKGGRPALWIASKGANVAAIGYVARGGGTDYHATTEEAAIDGLAAKIAKLAALKSAKQSAAQSPITAEKIAGKFGFCRAGIAATAIELGLDPAGSYTPAEIIAAAKGKSLEHSADFARFVRHFGKV